jgi:Flp pilus assembly pilin Flp
MSVIACLRQLLISDDSGRGETHSDCEKWSVESVRGANMSGLLRKLWRRDEGQDIAEYAVMLAVILVIVVGTIRLVGGNANNVFSSVASAIQ